MLFFIWLVLTLVLYLTFRAGGSVDPDSQFLAYWILLIVGCVVATGWLFVSVALFMSPSPAWFF